MPRRSRRPKTVPRPLGPLASTITPPPSDVPETGSSERLLETTPAIQAMIDSINSHDGSLWGLFTPNGPVTAQAQKPDKTYRTQPLNGDEEFTFNRIYMGKRGKLIFQFTPIDPAYQHYEFAEDKVFQAVPALESHIVKALGGNEGLAFDQPGEGFLAAASLFRANFKRTLEEEKRRAEEAKIKESKDRIENNPIWGIF
jgi:hypothetical protein